MADLLSDDEIQERLSGLEEWRREPRACGDELEAEVAQELEWLDAAYTDDVLERLVRASGKETG